MQQDNSAVTVFDAALVEQCDGWDKPTVEEQIVRAADLCANIPTDVSLKKRDNALRLGQIDLNPIPPGPKVHFTEPGTAAQKLGKDHAHLPDEFNIEFGPDYAGSMKMTAVRKAMYLVALRSHGISSMAAKMVGVSIATINRAKIYDEMFASAVAEADFEINSMIEDELIRRSVHGIEEPIVFKGQIQYVLVPNPEDPSKPIPVIQTITKHSNELLMFIAKARMPDKYGTKSSVDVNVKSGVMIVGPAQREDESEAAAQKALKRLQEKQSLDRPKADANE